MKIEVLRVCAVSSKTGVASMVWCLVPTIVGRQRILQMVKLSTNKEKTAGSAVCHSFGCRDVPVCVFVFCVFPFSGVVSIIILLLLREKVERPILAPVSRQYPPTHQIPQGKG